MGTENCIGWIFLFVPVGILLNPAEIQTEIEHKKLLSKLSIGNSSWMPSWDK